MARGWESKAIESQQDDAARRKHVKPALSEAQRAAVEQRRSLELARARLAADLTRATALPHRDMLERAIADLDARIDALR